jgi:hypothetical protein
MPADPRAHAPAIGGALRTPADLLTLQRMIGNHAASRVVAGGGVLQRAPAASTEARLSAVEKKQRIQEKKLAALKQDGLARATFDERLASLEQAITRVTTGLENSKAGFEAAQIAQAQTDAMQTQLIGMAVALGLAVSFEWIFTAGLGAVGMSGKKLKDTVELLENPANSLVSSSINVTAAKGAADSAKQGAAPGSSPGGGAPGGSPLAFLTRNLEMLGGHKQDIAQAFITRSGELDKASDDAWERFDPTVQQAIYDKLLADLKAAGAGKEQLKPEAEITQILERHLWALWIKGNTLLLVQLDHPTPEHGGPPMTADDPTQPVYDLGTDVEQRLNAVEVSKKAGVVLTGHWYSSNTPDNWKKLLYVWAHDYREAINA